eukprot:c21382_g1_i2 orf=766-2496(-)
MEVLSAYEGLDEGDWISPRISFSQDFQISGRFSPKMQFKDSPEEEFSFNFRNSVNIDLPTDDSMLSADELFYNGKVRPLQNGAKSHAEHSYFDERNAGRSIENNPRCLSMTIESCRGGARDSRPYMSLHNSRCSSPSRTMSMPRTTPASPKAKSALPSSSSSTSIMPSSSSMSSSTSTSSSKYSSKFKEFFKLKKMNKDMSLPSLPSLSASAEISRECPHSSGSASCRQPSRSFWPFSRSNSAGESKTIPAASPPPRRSNSAGEGKTTSSSLLPTSIPSPKQPDQRTNRDSSCLASTNVPSKGLPYHANPTSGSPSPASSDMEFPLSNSNVAVKCNPSTAMAKKGLPPLPNSTVKKTSSFFVPAHCGSDAVSLSSQSNSSVPSRQACGTAHIIAENVTVSKLSSSPSASEAEPSHVTTCNSPACMREGTMLPDATKANGSLQHVSDVNPMVHKGRGPAASPGRPVRRGAHGNATRNFARGSPGRRGVWAASPGRGNGARVSIRNLDRGHVRPKDMLSRDGASVRISPVLNMAVPSLRGAKASSKSKIFSLGNLFSKREKVVTRAYAVLPPDSQSGG